MIEDGAREGGGGTLFGEWANTRATVIESAIPLPFVAGRGKNQQQEQLVLPHFNSNNNNNERANERTNERTSQKLFLLNLIEIVMNVDFKKMLPFHSYWQLYSMLSSVT